MRWALRAAREEENDGDGGFEYVIAGLTLGGICALVAIRPNALSGVPQLIPLLAHG
jgi:hypothetical protein